VCRATGPHETRSVATIGTAALVGMLTTMAVPKYHEFMLPILELSRDGQERATREVIDAMATRFHLTPEDCALLLPSGRQEVLYNRVTWAQTYLRAAGLLQATRRAHVRITDLGREVLANAPSQIDSSFLRRFPKFLEFKPDRAAGQAAKDHDAPSAKPEPNNMLPQSQTPEEVMSDAARSLRAHLKDDLLELVRQGSPAFFERLVVDLLQAMGYGGASTASGRVTGRVGDGGIDGIITEDRLGLDAVYLQAKRWQANVGRPTVQEFAGAMQGHKADKGVIITTSEFTSEARDFVRTVSTRIVLVGGAQLVDLMIDHGVGVRTVETHVIRKVDGDYFDGDYSKGA
jgi:restriction system protein